MPCAKRVLASIVSREVQTLALVSDLPYNSTWTRSAMAARHRAAALRPKLARAWSCRQARACKFILRAPLPPKLHTRISPVAVARARPTTLSPSANIISAHTAINREASAALWHKYIYIYKFARRKRREVIITLSLSRIAATRAKRPTRRRCAGFFRAYCLARRRYMYICINLLHCGKEIQLYIVY